MLRLSSGTRTPQPIAVTLPSLMSLLVAPQVYLHQLLTKKKKKMWQLLNLNPPKQAFFSPVYLPVLPEKIILKEQFPWLCPEGRELEGLLQFAVNVETGPFRDMTLTLELHTGKWLLVDISFHVKGHVRRNRPEKQLIPHHPQITLSQQLPTS